MHSHASFDGGNLDCGNGLLLLIRKHLDPLLPGQLLEIRSTERSVAEDLPAWCRLTGNAFVSATPLPEGTAYLVRKRESESAVPLPAVARPAMPAPEPLAAPAPIPTQTALPPLAVTGIGSWPRPAWLMRALHEYLEGRLPEAEFQQTADDAVRLAVAAQERAGVDLVTDGEQRRDSYASFVGSRLEGTQLVPITDLLPYVDDPEQFAQELQALDVPAQKVRHPAVFGPIARVRPLAVHELTFARAITPKPIKVALPGPYLLTRTLWMECVTDKPYPTREPLADAVVGILRAEIAALIATGAGLVQLDEPVLSEVVFGKPQADRSFMCGALSERKDPTEELAFAQDLLHRTLAGFPRERVAMHMCRGNWSKDERVALAGDYRPLVPLFRDLPVGTLFLELCTPRAGELEVLADLPPELQIGVGVVNQKLDTVESAEEVLARAERAVQLFGAHRVRLTPDCGFATFADNPIASATVAEAKLRTIADVAQRLRDRYA
ncbi:MAG: hypothetical protein LC104_06260 [Bacteroidales bacterium]|nr:hypothetical protein [Bacteroidales bacterium]